MARMKITSLITSIILACCCPFYAQTTPDVAAIADELTQVTKYEYGQSRAPLVAVEEFTRRALASPPALVALEQRFIAILQSDATLAGKDFICRQLSLIGSGNSVPVLAGMLRGTETFEMARYALERIPGDAVDQALREALPAVSSTAWKVGIINTLGNRGDPASVTFLENLSAGSESDLADAALTALATIGSAPACAVVVDAAAKETGELRPAVAEADLICADRLARGGDRSGAIAIYRRLYEPRQTVVVRVAALQGLATVGGSEAVPTLQQALAADEDKLRAAAVRGLAGVPGQQVTAIMMQAAESLPDTTQVQLLSALAERGDRSARPVLVKAAGSADANIRMAALEALGTLGGSEDVQLLTERSALASGREQEVARGSLYRLQAAEVDDAILKSLAEAEPKLKVELILAAGERAIATASAALLAAARDLDRSVRRVALRALRDTASADDVHALIELLSAYERQADRAEAQRTIASVIRRTDSSVKPVLSAYADATDDAVKLSLLWVMGQVGNASTLPTLRAAVASDSADIKREVIVALSNWPNDRPAADLYEIARDNSNLAHQILALRGYVQLVTLPSDRPHEATISLLKNAADLASRPDEKKTILAALPRYPCKGALDLARAALADSATAAEAEMAVKRIERQLP